MTISGQLAVHSYLSKVVQVKLQLTKGHYIHVADSGKSASHVMEVNGGEMVRTVVVEHQSVAGVSVRLAGSTDALWSPMISIDGAVQGSQLLKVGCVLIGLHVSTTMPVRITFIDWFGVLF